MRNKNAPKTLIIAIALIAITSIGSAMAYLTASDSSTNTITVGNVNIEIAEPGWERPRDLVPGQSITKDPKITNTGDNDAYVFMEVYVPKKEIYTYDGYTRERNEPAAVTQLFQLNRSMAYAYYTGTDTVSTQWVKLSEDTTNDDYNRYIYAYGTSARCTRVPAGSTTGALFQGITFCYAVEGQDLEKEDYVIRINGYAIQADNISDNDNGSADPAQLWNILQGHIAG